jgi:hypothetical protein
MLISQQQVLDFAVRRVDRGWHERRHHMALDPGALGTLIIGLDSIRAEAELTDAGRPTRRNASPPRRSYEASIRARLATGLRVLANRVEPRPAWR